MLPKPRAESADTAQTEWHKAQRAQSEQDIADTHGWQRAVGNAFLRDAEQSHARRGRGVTKPQLSCYYLELQGSQTNGGVEISACLTGMWLLGTADTFVPALLATGS